MTLWCYVMLGNAVRGFSHILEEAFVGLCREHRGKKGAGSALCWVSCWWFEAVLHSATVLSISGYAGCLYPKLLHGHWKEEGCLSEHKDFRLDAIFNLLLVYVIPPPWLHVKLREDSLWIDAIWSPEQRQAFQCRWTRLGTCTILCDAYPPLWSCPDATTTC